MSDKEGYKILSITKTLVFYAIIIIIIIIANQSIFQISPLSQSYTFALAILLDLLVFFIAIEIVINNFSINRSIDTLLHSYLVAAIATIIIVIAFGLFLFIIHEYIYPSPSNQVLTNLVQGSSSDMNDETLLNILAILISFTGLLAAVLSYAFNRIIKNEIHDKIKNMARDERIASRIEMHISTSNIFSQLYRLLELVNKDNEMYIPLESMRFLEKAMVKDTEALYLTEELTDKGAFMEIILRALNNQAFNLCLKQERWAVLKKNKKKVKKLKEKKADPTVTVGEILTVLKTKEKLLEVINNGDIRLFHDCSGNQRDAWIDTCGKIDKMINETPEWKEQSERLIK